VALKRQLQTRVGAGNDPGSMSAAEKVVFDEREKIIEFVTLAIKVPLLKRDQLIYAAIFFSDVPQTVTQIRSSFDKARDQLATLYAEISSSLQHHGHSSQDRSWLSSAAFRDVVRTVCEREKRARTEEIERLLEEYDHFRADLTISTRTTEITRLRKQMSWRYKKIVSSMRVYLWWDSFSAVDGCARDGWDTTGATLQALLKDGDSRVFPWDQPVSVGAKTLPRRLVLKFLNADEELARSKEEWSIFLPDSLNRAIRFYGLYADNIDYVLADTDTRLQAQLSIINNDVHSATAQAQAAVEVQELTYRRAHLCRRRIEVAERQEQGRLAVANWNGENQAFSNEPLERVLLREQVGVEVDEDTPELGNTVLAAGAATPAAEPEVAIEMADVPGESEEEDETGEEVEE